MLQILCSSVRVLYDWKKIVVIFKKYIYHLIEFQKAYKQWTVSQQIISFTDVSNENHKICCHICAVPAPRFDYIFNKKIPSKHNALMLYIDVVFMLPHRLRQWRKLI